MSRPRFARLVVVVLMAVACPRLSAAADVTLAWDPPSDGITVGFVLYYGTAPRTYSQQVDVGAATSHIVSGLSAGTTYYFAVRAYSATGALSDFSAEVSETIPRPVVTTLALTSSVPSPQLVGTTVTWSATATGGVAPYEFQWAVFHADQWTVGPWSLASSWTWTPSAPGTDYYVKVAVRSSGSSSTSGELTQMAPFTVTTSAGGSTSASFVGTDTATQGNWQGVYGGDGYNVVYDAASYPAYATVTPSGHSSYPWITSTTDVRALWRASGLGRLAAAWYGYVFDIDVTVTGGARQVALYALDWDGTSRSQRFDVLNRSTLAVLDSRTISSFQGGQYLRWTIAGDVKIRVTRLAGPNAVVSGMFFGTPSVNLPPTVTLTNPSDGASFPAGSTVALAATASDSDGTVSSVEFRANGTLLATDSAEPFAFNWVNVPAGSYSLTAVARDDLDAVTTSTSVSITVTASGGAASASFLGTDTTTKGNWQGVYGGDGYRIAYDASSNPAYAVVTMSGHSSYAWTESTSDLRALRRASGMGRLAATWYGYAYDIDLNLTGGAHQVALYAVDWDGRGRSQRFDVLDRTTLAVLDSRTISNFQDGQYLRWTVTGHVKIRVTLLAGDNAVVSGLFFGPPTAYAGHFFTAK